MEKQGVVRPGVTPDVEKKLQPGVKVASDKEQTTKLDDDMTKRLADQATERLGN